jgi:hypothetical protein
MDETTETMRMAPLKSDANSVLSVFVSERRRSISTGRTSASIRKVTNTLAKSASVTSLRSPLKRIQWTIRLRRTLLRTRLRGPLAVPPVPSTG